METESVKRRRVSEFGEGKREGGMKLKNEEKMKKNIAEVKNLEVKC